LAEGRGQKKFGATETVGADRGAESGDGAAAGGDAGGIDDAAGAALGYLKVRFQEFDWQTLHPSLAAYAAALEQRPSFANSVPYPQTITNKVV